MANLQITRLEIISFSLCFGAYHQSDILDLLR